MKLLFHQISVSKYAIIKTKWSQLIEIQRDLPKFDLYEYNHTHQCIILIR